MFWNAVSHICEFNILKVGSMGYLRINNNGFGEILYPRPSARLQQTGPGSCWFGLPHQKCIWRWYRLWGNGTGLVRLLSNQTPRCRGSVPVRSHIWVRWWDPAAAIWNKSATEHISCCRSFGVWQSTVVRHLRALGFLSKVLRWTPHQLTREQR